LLQFDPNLANRRKELIVDAAKKLDSSQMITFDESSGNFGVTDLGRVASHFYIGNETILTINENFNDT
jgi:replicative superfamily II helicase